MRLVNIISLTADFKKCNFQLLFNTSWDCQPHTFWKRVSVSCNATQNALLLISVDVNRTIKCGARDDFSDQLVVLKLCREHR